MPTDKPIKCTLSRYVRTATQWDGNTEPDFEPTRELLIGDWIIRNEQGAVVEVMSDQAFKASYQVIG